MKFLADGMLGGLSRWLRILGQTVEYDASSRDDDLLERAQRGNMILLTSDQELFSRAVKRGVGCLLVRGGDEPERLAEVTSSYGISLEIDMASTKCPECGESLHVVNEKREIANRVPAASLRVYTDFWACNRASCGKVYWIGSHWRQIHNTLERAKLLSAGRLRAQNGQGCDTYQG